MAKVDLIAKRAGHYPQRVRVGERFSVSPTDARLLIAVGAATPAPKAPPLKEEKQGTLTLPPKGRYARRDMVADDPAPVSPPTPIPQDE